MVRITSVSSNTMFRARLWALRKKFQEGEEAQLLESIPAHSESLLIVRLAEAFSFYTPVTEVLNAFEQDYCHDKYDFQGLYTEAFFNGVRMVVHEIDEGLNRVENDVLKNPNGVQPINLNYLDLKCTVLYHVHHAIKKVLSKEVHGCRILDLVYDYCHSGSPYVCRAFKMIEKHCQAVFLQQIKSWIIYAYIQDSFNEFFIQPSLDGSFVSFGDSMGSSFCSYSSVDTTSSIFKSEHEVQEKYILNEALLPKCIQLSEALKILFVGETLINFRQNPSLSTDDNLSMVNISVYGVDDKEVGNRIDKILHGDAPMFALGVVVNDLWLAVNKHWKQLADEKDLLGQLRLITGIFLLGRGELFQEFLTQGRQYLQSDVTQVSAKRLNSALDNAASCVYSAEKCSLLDRLKFEVPYDPVNKATVWSVFVLKYRPPWPLHAIFTSELLKKYNQIFKFLLMFKNAQILVHGVWKETSLCSTHCPQITQVRNLLLIFTDNLLNYFFVDVIQTEVETLEETVKTCDTFDRIQKAHAIFVSNLLSKLFLIDSDEASEENSDSLPLAGESMVYTKLLSLVEVCHEFVKLVTEEQNLNDSISEELLMSVRVKFRNCVKPIMQVFRQNESTFDNLQSFMMRLDYNGYFSSQEIKM